MQSAYKRGCTGTGNRQIFYISVLWPLNADLAERLSFSFPRLYESHIPHKMACMSPFMVRMHMTKKKIRQMPGSFAVGRSSGKAAARLY